MPHKAVMAGSLEPTDCNDTGPHGYWMGTFGAAGQMCIFIRCATANIVMRCIRQTGTRQTVCCGTGQRSLLEQRPEYQYFRLYIKGKKRSEYSFDVQEIGKLDRIVDITDQTVPDYDYEKLAGGARGFDTWGIHTQYAKKEPGVCTAKALEYGVNALLGYDC